MAAKTSKLPLGHIGDETRKGHAEGNLSSDPQAIRGLSPIITIAGTEASGLLVILADALDDLEAARIAAENRARALSQRGMPMLAARQQAFADVFREQEKEAVKDLTKAMREHPLGEWVKNTKGLGERQVARLLGVLGDPVVRSPNVAKLWAYCGFHVVDGKRPVPRRGEVANWNHVAKKRAWLCARSCMRNRQSPYRAIYDKARANWADRDVPDGHKHAHALSLTAKTILKDLWVASKRCHEAAQSD